MNGETFEMTVTEGKLYEPLASPAVTPDSSEDDACSVVTIEDLNIVRKFSTDDGMDLDTDDLSVFTSFFSKKEDRPTTFLPDDFSDSTLPPPTLPQWLPPLGFPAQTFGVSSSPLATSLGTYSSLTPLSKPPGDPPFVPEQSHYAGWHHLDERRAFSHGDIGKKNAAATENKHQENEGLFASYFESRRDVQKTHEELAVRSRTTRDPPGTWLGSQCLVDASSSLGTTTSSLPYPQSSVRTMENTTHAKRATPSSTSNSASPQHVLVALSRLTKSTPFESRRMLRATIATTADNDGENIAQPRLASASICAKACSSFMLHSPFPYLSASPMPTLWSEAQEWAASGRSSDDTGCSTEIRESPRSTFVAASSCVRAFEEQRDCSTCTTKQMNSPEEHQTRLISAISYPQLQLSPVESPLPHPQTCPTAVTCAARQAVKQGNNNERHEQHVAIALGASGATTTTTTTTTTISTVDNNRKSLGVLPSVYREISQHDFLTGRGGHVSRHPGNRRVREIVLKLLPQYTDQNASIAKKACIVERVIRNVKSHGGSFLTKDVVSGTWVKCTSEECRRKVSQRFREEASGRPNARRGRGKKRNNGTTGSVEHWEGKL